MRRRCRMADRVVSVTRGRGWCCRQKEGHHAGLGTQSEYLNGYLLDVQQNKGL